MPTILVVRGFRFYFFSNENHEPIHVHVEKADAAAKWWMNPITEEYSYGFSPKERKEIGKLIVEHGTLIKDKWNEHFK
jgi:hypothetical protein